MARFTVQDLSDAYERGMSEFDATFKGLPRHLIPKYKFENPVLPFTFEELNEQYERGWRLGYDNLVERSRTSATRRRWKDLWS